MNLREEPIDNKGALKNYKKFQIVKDEWEVTPKNGKYISLYNKNCYNFLYYFILIFQAK